MNVMNKNMQLDNDFRRGPCSSFYHQAAFSKNCVNSFQSDKIVAGNGKFLVEIRP